jgi:hypothetical protein
MTAARYPPRPRHLRRSRAIFAVPEPSVPVTEVVLVALGALVLANVVAAIPGRIAARTSTALVLRAQ